MIDRALRQRTLDLVWGAALKNPSPEHEPQEVSLRQKDRTATWETRLDWLQGPASRRKAVDGRSIKLSENAAGGGLSKAERCVALRARLEAF